MADIFLAVVVLGPLVITYLLKSNAALGFLTLCLSFVLSTSIIGDLKHLLSQVNLTVAQSTLGIILLVVPLLITLLITRSSSRRKGLKFWLQLAVALCVGGFLALSLGPIMAHSSELDISSSQFWDQLQNIQLLIIGLGAILSLALIWSGGFNKSKKH